MKKFAVGGAIAALLVMSLTTAYSVHAKDGGRGGDEGERGNSSVNSNGLQLGQVLRAVSQNENENEGRDMGNLQTSLTITPSLETKLNGAKVTASTGSSLSASVFGINFSIAITPSTSITGVGAVTTTTPVANPVPSTVSIAPTSTTSTGSGAFILTVNGANFMPTSVVNWNGSSRVTTFLSANQLTAQILASDVTATGTASVTVVNPIPGGGVSNSQIFGIATSTAGVSTTAAIPNPIVVSTTGGTINVGDIIDVKGTIDGTTGIVTASAIRDRAGAQNIQSLQAQIAALMQQIRMLRAQLGL